MRCPMSLALLVGLLLTASGPAGLSAAESPPAEPSPGYFRFPAIRGETIVFVAEGDLWRVSLGDGQAVRLTTHLGPETHPAISPDGKLIAFSASYEGPQEVYTMPLGGGLPERQTYEGDNARVVGWASDGRVLYATRVFSTLPSTQLATIDLTSGMKQPLPLAQASEGCYEPEGQTLFFTRLAKHWSHTKRYRGGTAQQIWSYTAGDPEAIPLTTNYPGTSRHPMWWQGRVYFVTDRDGTMNLWSMRPNGTELRQNTRHEGWDIQSPSLADGRIVYQLGADLHLYDIASEEDRALPITLASDFDQMRVRWVEKPLEHLSAAHLSPSGDRLVLTSYGQVFIAPVKHGRLIELTRHQNVRYRGARFLPDGESVLVLSDESGEVEWWQIAATGTTPPKQLTTNGEALRLGGVPSPDGRYIAHSDHDQRLWLFDTETRQTTQIAFSPQWGFDDPTWSPDSRWLTYAMQAPNSMRQIFVYRVADAAQSAVTSDRFSSYSAQWSPDGQWLYFLSNRTFRSRVPSPWGQRQPEPYFDQQTKIYMLPLQAGLRSPFRPPDELSPEPSSALAADRSESDNNQVIPDVEIDLAGIRMRLREAPIPAGNYSALALNAERLFWISYDSSVDAERSLMALPIGHDDPQPLTLAAKVTGYELSADGRKLLIRKDREFYVIAADADADADLADAQVDLADWKFAIDPREKWRQMFVESWRLERDYFYDPNMHGLDWLAILHKYLPLVERVTDRAELADLQAQMASELSALHIGVWGGDHREPAQSVDVGSLGARLRRDPQGGGYRVMHLYGSDPDYPHELAPLAQPDAAVREGEVIVAINGVATLDVRDPGELLRSQAKRDVRLTVIDRDGTSRDVIVKPISPRRAYDLRYDEWEYTRRVRVDSRGAREIGYLHLRDMGSENIAEWQRDFYPVFNRRGLIVDVRHNGGGNIDSWILEKLMRTAWMYWIPRVGDPYWNMQYAFRGHICVLIDEWTMSDGEAFAEGFRRLGLGKLIGTRTWGGEIWLSHSNRLVDDGIVTAAEFGVYGPEGRWLIEGHGVDPDIVVDNLPRATFEGQDAQLDAAIAHLQALIREDPRDVPEPPPYPDWSNR